MKSCLQYSVSSYYDNDNSLKQNPKDKLLITNHMKSEIMNINRLQTNVYKIYEVHHLVKLTLHLNPVKNKVCLLHSALPTENTLPSAGHTL